MADPRHALLAKKLKILKDAKTAAAEIDHDLKELERITAKYGLETVEGRPATEKQRDLTDGSVEPISRRSPREAEALIRAAHKPLYIIDIYEGLRKRGLKIGGERPRSTLSAYLSQAPNLESIRRGWWWLKGEPIPEGTTWEREN